MKKKIRNIIFDLGGVLVDLDFTSLIMHFKQLGATFDSTDYRKVISDPVFLSFEMGFTSPSRFRDRLRAILEISPASDAEMDEAWCSLLGSVPQNKVTLLQYLAPKYRLFLYSNTNAIHISYFKNRFLAEHSVEFESLFDRTFYSFDLHDRKPQLSGYEKIFSITGILPQETLFVDDFIQNIDVAKSMGIRVYHYLPGTDLKAFFSGF
jgi:putative hydrolase of the HAD superfamily